MRVRVLCERLIRKFGYDFVDSIVPNEHKKLLSNIRYGTTRDQWLAYHGVTHHTYSLQNALFSSQTEWKIHSKQRERAIKKKREGGNTDRSEDHDTTQKVKQAPATFEEALYASEDEMSDEDAHDSKKVISFFLVCLRYI